MFLQSADLHKTWFQTIKEIYVLPEHRKAIVENMGKLKLQVTEIENKER